MTHHQMAVEDSTDDEVLFVCPTCGRRTVLRRAGGQVVVDEGDRHVTHSGGVGVSVGAVRAS